ncbi:MAG: polyprenyl diphosphate synthase [Bacilli bacterium]|nr:polyprenyl diphosphate synthase [Bacilli bacterium]
MNELNIKHIAFIMDGNGRWAKKRGLPRHLGHKEGCERVIEIYEECYDSGVFVMSLYAFSTENWNRPKAEISHLFTYLELFFKREIDRLVRDGCQVRTSGDLTKLPLKTQKVIAMAKERTKDCKNFVFNICLNYGGKEEIVRAAKIFAKKVQEGKDIESLTEDEFQTYLYTEDLPPVDLLVRTSGEQRTSNFMPWQLAYAEFVFTPTHWPDFTKAELRKCFDEFKNRDRRFGGIKE